MVKYKSILKVIEQETNKCKATARALKIGESFEETENGYKYSDGTQITLDDYGDIKSITLPNGETLEYMQGEDNFHGKDHEFFKPQKDYLINKHGEETYKELCEFSDKWASWRGIAINQYLYGSITYEQLEERFNKAYEQVKGFHGEKEFHGNGKEELKWMLETEKKFNKICSETPLTQYGSPFFSVRGTRLYDNDQITKKIVSYNGHTSASTGISHDDSRMFTGGEDGWKIITVYETDNKAGNGLFLGNLKNDNNYGVSMDWEHELHSAPKQKFERTMIDEEHHYIIQKPYKPSMG